MDHQGNQRSTAGNHTWGGISGEAIPAGSINETIENKEETGTVPTFLGLGILTDAEMQDLIAGKREIMHPAGVSELFRINGNPLPYDEHTNICYLHQNIDWESFQGIIFPTRTDISGYWALNDEKSLPDHAIAIEQGQMYALWIIANDTYARIQVCFTGLPVFHLSTEDKALTGDYSKGNISVWNDNIEEENTIGIENCVIRVRESASGEVITMKIQKHDAGIGNALSLPQLESVRNWKLYSLAGQPDPYRMYLAFQIWNQCCELNALKAECAFAEVIIDGEYRGLYLIRPRQDENYISELHPEDTVLDTDDLEPSAVPHSLYQQYRIDNLSDVALYLQATFSYANLYDDTKVIESHDGKYYMIPGKPEYTFGSFPGRYRYMEYQFDQRILTSDDFGSEGMNENMQMRWQEARGAFLSEEEIQKELDQITEKLRKSGFAVRSGLTSPCENPAEIWTSPDEQPMIGDLLEAREYQLISGIRNRFSAIDAWAMPEGDE